VSRGMWRCGGGRCSRWWWSLLTVVVAHGLCASFWFALWVLFCFVKIWVYTPSLKRIVSAPLTNFYLLFIKLNINKIM